MATSIYSTNVRTHGRLEALMLKQKAESEGEEATVNIRGVPEEEGSNMTPVVCRSCYS